jgi:hypothetical protein
MNVGEEVPGGAFTCYGNKTPMSSCPSGMSREIFSRVCDKVDPGVNPGDHAMWWVFPQLRSGVRGVCRVSVVSGA